MSFGGGEGGRGEEGKGGWGMEARSFKASVDFLLYIDPSLVPYAEVDGSPAMMLVWLTDSDNNLITTTTDRSMVRIVEVRRKIT